MMKTILNTQHAQPSAVLATENFLKLLREVQKIDPEFPLQYAICISIISMHEGLSITDLSQKANLSLSTISRIVTALSEDRQKKKAYNLVQVNIDPSERRRKKLYLTQRGRDTIKNIHVLMNTFID